MRFKPCFIVYGSVYLIVFALGAFLAIAPASGH
jgi:hypothetical protein